MKKETFYMIRERAEALRLYIGSNVVISESMRENKMPDEVRVDIQNFDGGVALQMFHAGISLGMKVIREVVYESN